jgi:ferredoxin-NADP reductase
MAAKEIPAAGFGPKLLNRVEFAEGTMAFYFEKPSQFDFKPGQSADVTLLNPPETDSEGNTRTFSIASSPFENQLMFATRMRDTAFKRSLKKLALGAEVKIDSAMGSFTLHKNSAKPAVFLAGGIGITPFLSIVAADHDQIRHRVYLFLFQPATRGCTFSQRLADAGEEQLKLPAYMHDDRNAEIAEGMERRNGFDQQRDVVETSAQPAGAYLLHCRSSPHGHGMRKMLLGADVDEDDIRTEEFADY